MSATSPNLELPYLFPAQAQKHVTYNETLRALDAIVQLSVADKDLAAPPPAPPEGARYIVAAGASGAWAGQSARIAAWQDGAWAFLSPRAGWLSWVADEDQAYVWDGAAWGPLVAQANLNPVLMAGINATADMTNRLAVSAAASLFNHDGAGHQLKINKANAGDTASQLFQTGFSGRAEIGLTADDDFHFKVSANGSTWSEALVLLGASGAARLKSFTVAGLPAAVAAGAGALAYVSNESGGAVLAFSDGAAWRRVTDRAAVT